MQKLITEYEAADMATLGDVFLCIAGTIEDSLIQARAIPGEDYMRLDLYKLAAPFALEQFRKNNLSFTAEWPSRK